MDDPLDEVIAGLKAARTEHPLPDRSIEAIYTLAVDCLQSGRSAEARTSFEILTGQRPAEARFWAGLGHSLLDTGSSEDALLPFLLATRLDRQHPGYMMGLAQCCADRELSGHAAYGFGIAAEMARVQGDAELAQRARARLELMGFSV
jgi:tetratricopeptide (TPR) repeat protein